jgi:hypothetical protein
VVADIDIWRVAPLFSKQHGADAGVIAARRADAMLAKGDVEGATIWKRIIAAIDGLRRSQPHQGEHRR